MILLSPTKFPQMSDKDTNELPKIISNESVAPLSIVGETNASIINENSKKNTVAGTFRKRISSFVVTNRTTIKRNFSMSYYKDKRDITKSMEGCTSLDSTTTNDNNYGNKSCESRNFFHTIKIKNFLTFKAKSLKDKSFVKSFKRRRIPLSDSTSDSPDRVSSSATSSKSEGVEDTCDSESQLDSLTCYMKYRSVDLDSGISFLPSPRAVLVNQESRLIGIDYIETDNNDNKNDDNEESNPAAPLTPEVQHFPKSQGEGQDREQESQSVPVVRGTPHDLSVIEVLPNESGNGSSAKVLEGGLKHSKSLSEFFYQPGLSSKIFTSENDEERKEEDEDEDKEEEEERLESISLESSSPVKFGDKLFSRVFNDNSEATSHASDKENNLGRSTLSLSNRIFSSPTKKMNMSFLPFSGFKTKSGKSPILSFFDNKDTSQTTKVSATDNLKTVAPTPVGFDPQSICSLTSNLVSSKTSEGNTSLISEVLFSPISTTINIFGDNYEGQSSLDTNNEENVECCSPSSASSSKVTNGGEGIIKVSKRREITTAETDNNATVTESTVEEIKQTSIKFNKIANILIYDKSDKCHSISKIHRATSRKSSLFRRISGSFSKNQLINKRIASGITSSITTTKKSILKNKFNACANSESMRARSCDQVAVGDFLNFLDMHEKNRMEMVHFLPQFRSNQIDRYESESDNSSSYSGFMNKRQCNTATFNAILEDNSQFKEKFMGHMNNSINQSVAIHGNNGNVTGDTCIVDLSNLRQQPFIFQSIDLGDGGEDVGGGGSGGSGAAESEYTPMTATNATSISYDIYSSVVSNNLI